MWVCYHYGEYNLSSLVRLKIGSNFVIEWKESVIDINGLFDISGS